MKTTGGHARRRRPSGRDELRAIFRQITLTLGGLFAVYEADDELMWAVTRELGKIFAIHLEPRAEGPEKRPRPHPALVELLASLDRPFLRSRTHRSKPAPGSAGESDQPEQGAFR
jgi:hypothetical protein